MGSIWLLGRNTAFRNRHHRRIYRKGLSGSKKASALFSGKN
jgi:hypothetical protein